jgi:hypothetical protein
MHKKNAEDLNALNVKHEKAIQETSGRIQEYAKMHFEMSSDAYETNKARMEKLTKDNKLALEGMKNLFQITTNDYLKKNSEIYDSGKKSVEQLYSKLEKTITNIVKDVDDLKQVTEIHRSNSIKYTVMLAVLSFVSIGLSLCILWQLK